MIIDFCRLIEIRNDKNLIGGLSIDRNVPMNDPSVLLLDKDHSLDLQSNTIYSLK